MANLSQIIIFDYIVARKGNIHVPSLYDGSKGGLYWFKSGVNWAGVFAWIGGTVMGLPGLVGQYQPKIVSQAAKNMYMMGWVLTFVTSAVIYVVLITIFKVKVYPPGFEQTPKEYEWMAKEGRDGFFEGEREGEIYAPPSPQVADGEEFHLGEKTQKMQA